MEMVDMTGKPRSDVDLEEAIDCIKIIMVKHPTVLPLLTIHAMDILSFLRELQGMRKLLAEAKKKRLESE